MDKLDRLARREAAQRKRKSRPDRPPPDTGKRMLQISLLSGWHGRLRGGLFIAPIFIMVLTSTQLGAFSLLLLIPAYLLAYFIAKRIEAWDFDRQTTWLRTRPYPFDLDGYQSVLSQDYSIATALEVVVELETPPSRKRLETLRAAAVGALTGASASVVEERLRILGPKLKTSFRRSKSTPVTSNILLHQWFRACDQKVLQLIQQAHPIASVRVGLERAASGEIEASKWVREQREAFARARENRSSGTS